MTDSSAEQLEHSSSRRRGGSSASLTSVVGSVKGKIEKMGNKLNAKKPQYAAAEEAIQLTPMPTSSAAYDQMDMGNPDAGRPEATGKKSSYWFARDGVDALYARMYTYYYSKGMRCLIASRVIELLNLGFTIVFSTFMLVVIDWPLLMTCTRCVVPRRFRARVESITTCGERRGSVTTGRFPPV